MNAQKEILEADGERHESRDSRSKPDLESGEALLTELERRFLGMYELKSQLRLLWKGAQGLSVRRARGDRFEPYLHTVQMGNPGTGKTSDRSPVPEANPRAFLPQDVLAAKIGLPVGE